MTRVAEEVAREATAVPSGWDVFREFYGDQIREAAESLFGQSALNIQTVMMVQAADCLRVRQALQMVSPTDEDNGRLYLQLERLAAAQLRHLRLMAERHGANATADGQMVVVPEGLQLDLFDVTKIHGDDSIVS
jgi:hypothetical protein